MKPLLLPLAGLVLCGAWWLHQHGENQCRVAELASLRAARTELRAKESEHGRLQALQPDAAEIAALQQAAAEATRLRAEIATREAAARARHFAVGEWTPVAQWRDRGSASPRAAVETALWAAAGGDAAKFSGLLEIDDAVRAQTNGVIAGIPPALRDTYPSAEALISAFAIKQIPLGEAQIVWSHQRDDDHATIGVFLNRPEATPAGGGTAVAEGASDSPPRTTANPRTSATFLSLHRTDAGWRLVVPPSAVTRIAKELGRVTAN